MLQRRRGALGAVDLGGVPTSTPNFTSLHVSREGRTLALSVRLRGGRPDQPSTSVAGGAPSLTISCCLKWPGPKSSSPAGWGHLVTKNSEENGRGLPDVLEADGELVLGYRLVPPIQLSQGDLASLPEASDFPVLVSLEQPWRPLQHHMVCPRWERAEPWGTWMWKQGLPHLQTPHPCSHSSRDTSRYLPSSTPLP